ncbi:zinc ribbon domain-containing protein [uncultured Desulfosarcina sp.]|uniref:FmdB family zinc ribbon protein n=1 Tax=uncultured Desulfosarcina sp. TaxID=218289 RepID=UPI0029C7217A|nr:zinc ribbon domain-containing protein [uncultured Desulfosarcina sp.]
MPLYEYQCTECGEIEEAIQKFSDAPLTTCRHCSGKLNKLISQSSFHLKGTGWYVTDYSKKTAAAADSKNPESTTVADKKSSTGGSDAKTTKADD